MGGACWGGGASVWEAQDEESPPLGRDGRGTSTPEDGVARKHPEQPDPQPGPVTGRPRDFQTAPRPGWRSPPLLKHKPRPAPPRLLVTRRLRQQKQADPPGRMREAAEVTYSSRAGQRPAAPARATQTDVVTLASLLTGAFALGRQDERKRTCDRPPAALTGRSFHGERRLDGGALCAPGPQNKPAPATSCLCWGTRVSCRSFSKDVKDPSNCPRGAYSSPLCRGGDCRVPRGWGDRGGQEAAQGDGWSCWSMGPMAPLALPVYWSRATPLCPRGALQPTSQHRKEALHRQHPGQPDTQLPSSSAGGLGVPSYEQPNGKPVALSISGF